MVLDDVLPRLVAPDSDMADVGCGDSLLMDVLTASRTAYRSVLLVDSSATMLGYSERWRRAGAQLVLADVEHLPVPADSFDLVVSVLGDPYNTPGFWAETSRTLKPGGSILFTTPSYEWSRAFRGGRRAAAFDRLDGQDLAVASIVLAPSEQRRLLEGVGLSLVDRMAVPLRRLTGAISPKVSVLPSLDSPVVTAYLARKTPLWARDASLVASAGTGG
jgi:SAM-dependent methyltransferase